MLAVDAQWNVERGYEYFVVFVIRLARARRKLHCAVGICRERQGTKCWMLASKDSLFNNMDSDPVNRDTDDDCLRVLRKVAGQRDRGLLSNSPAMH